MTELKRSTNPLIVPQGVAKVPLEDLAAPVTLRRARTTGKRELRELRARQTAMEAIAGLDHQVEIFGFTKGQFSLLDLIAACLEYTGAARVTVSTWTAARHEIQAMAQFKGAGLITEARWLVDYTFARRDPAAAAQIRETFGVGSVRVANTHSKIALFENDEWDLVLRSSMNLNMNPRFEDFTLAHDPEMMAFLRKIFDEIWSHQEAAFGEKTKPGEFARHFRDNM